MNKEDFKRKVQYDNLVLETRRYSSPQECAEHMVQKGGNLEWLYPYIDWDKVHKFILDEYYVTKDTETGGGCS